MRNAASFCPSFTHTHMYPTPIRDALAAIDVHILFSISSNSLFCHFHTSCSNFVHPRKRLHAKLIDQACQLFFTSVGEPFLFISVHPAQRPKNIGSNETDTLSDTHTMESYLQLWYWPSAVQWCVDHACLSWVSSHPNQYRFSSFAIPHHIGHSSINRDGKSEGGGQPLGAADYAMPHWFVIIHVPTRVWHFSRRAATGKVTSFSGKEKGKDEIWKSSRNMKKGEGNVNFTNAALYPSFSHHLVPN